MQPFCRRKPDTSHHSQYPLGSIIVSLAQFKMQSDYLTIDMLYSPSTQYLVTFEVSLCIETPPNYTLIYPKYPLRHYEL